MKSSNIVQSNNTISQLSEDHLSVRARVGLLCSGGVVELNLLSNKACHGCDGGCLWRWKSSPSLRIKSSLQTHVNELVTVSVSSRSLMFGTLFLHGLPWVGLLLGTALGISSFGNDLGTLLGSLVGLFTGSLLGRYCEKYVHISPRVMSDQEI